VLEHSFVYYPKDYEKRLKKCIVQYLQEKKLMKGQSKNLQIPLIAVIKTFQV